MENIHKVIDPLFLDDLKAEYEDARQVKNLSKRNKRLLELQDKLSKLKFLDPACGSGNFLTETYTSLRTLENDIIRIVFQGQKSFEFADPIKVSLSQFFGIEINDFAVSVAKTALWIAESQMMLKTKDIVQKELDFLPLKSNANIHEGNALRIDWNDVIGSSDLSYIMGNPPFVGMKYQSKTQKEDILLTNVQLKGLDYVTCWFYKSFEFMKGTNIKAALVSTNSICQGEQVARFWQPLTSQGLKIIFSYRTFSWENLSNNSGSAHVHCIIVGFKDGDQKNKKIFDGNKVIPAININPYLLAAEDRFVTSRNSALYDVHKMIAPNKPCDYNHLKVEPDEYKDMVKKCPISKTYLKRMVGAQELLKDKERWCLWLVDCDPKVLKQMPPVLERVKLCKEARIKANTAESLKLSLTPSLFREQQNPKKFLIIPCVSSERRDYIPMKFLDNNWIPVMGTLIIPNATLFEFGVITSSVHMSWMRTVAGRLKSDYRYSKDIVYNNFPWPQPTAEQKSEIEKTAVRILEVREKFPTNSLSDLYDPDVMPLELRKAHIANDKAVLSSYGFKPSITEFEIVGELFKLYEKRLIEIEKEEKKAKKEAKAVKLATRKKSDLNELQQKARK